jgi:hypothetical protein
LGRDDMSLDGGHQHEGTDGDQDRGLAVHTAIVTGWPGLQVVSAAWMRR